MRYSTVCLLTLALSSMVGCGYSQSSIGIARGIQDIREHSKESKRRDELHATELNSRAADERRREEEHATNLKILNAELAAASERTKAGKEESRDRAFSRRTQYETVLKLSNQIAVDLPDSPTFTELRRSAKTLFLHPGQIDTDAMFTPRSEIEALQREILVSLRDDQRLARFITIEPELGLDTPDKKATANDSLYLSVYFFEWENSDQSCWRLVISIRSGAGALLGRIWKIESECSTKAESSEPTSSQPAAAQ